MFQQKSISALLKSMDEGSTEHLKNFVKLKWGLEDFNYIISNCPLSKRYVSLLKNGKLMELEHSMPQVNHIQHNFQPDLSHTEVKKAIKKGFTVQLRNVQQFSRELNQLQFKLMDSFKCYVNLNVYFTPKGEKGSDSHFDPYDNLIIQISGSKKWSVDSGKKKIQIILKEGDVLYLPAGKQHEVKSLSEDSLHLTVGIHQLSLTKYLHTLARYSRDEFLIPENNRISAQQIRQKAKKIMKRLDGLSDKEIEDSLINYWHENLASTFLDFDEKDNLSIDAQDGVWQFKGLERELHPTRGKGKK